jgi:hypothetical protein
MTLVKYYITQLPVDSPLQTPFHLYAREKDHKIKLNGLEYQMIQQKKNDEDK